MPSFIFLWCGEEALDDGRELFKRWGYKRCEDIVWVKTNKNKHEDTLPYLAADSFMFRSKEHCLVGLKYACNNRGDTRSASDHGFIHPNIDTDVIVAEEPDFADTEKPTELLRIVERFCLGRKRLHLFGKTPRKGWLTIGPSLPPTNYDKNTYESWFKPVMGKKTPKEILSIDPGKEFD